MNQTALDETLRKSATWRHVALLENRGRVFPGWWTPLIIHWYVHPPIGVFDELTHPPQGKYARAWSRNGSCSEGDTVFVPPCPVNLYAKDGVCVACPPLSYTLDDGALSVVGHFHLRGWVNPLIMRCAGSVPVLRGDGAPACWWVLRGRRVPPARAPDVRVQQVQSWGRGAVRVVPQAAVRDV